MSDKEAIGSQPQKRMISVRLQLDSGHEVRLTLQEDAPELAALFRILASRGSDAIEPQEQFLQLPLDGGTASCSFNSLQLVSVITEPPVLVQIEQPAPPEATALNQQQAQAPVLVNTPRYLIVDDFLSPDEYQGLLAYALEHQDQFESGTVVGHESPHRKNRVIMNFEETPQSRLLCNRLLTCLPLFARQLELPLFPVGRVESQLTASNDGHYYRVHCDAGGQGTDGRELTCVYYFFKEPRPFSGGGLRLYDALCRGDQREVTSSFREIDAVSNRLVVFHSLAFHELMPIRCPSRKFSDSRFAITNWFQRNPEPSPEVAFGWGHLRCGFVPDQMKTAGNRAS